MRFEPVDLLQGASLQEEASLLTCDAATRSVSTLGPRMLAGMQSSLVNLWQDVADTVDVLPILVGRRLCHLQLPEQSYYAPASLGVVSKYRGL